MDAKQKVVAAIYGDLKESYVELPRVLAGLKDASPGTNYKLLVDDNYERETCTFKSVFWAFRPCIVGFVDTHFLNPCPKAHTEENPMKSKAQRPTKKTEEKEKSKEISASESNLQQQFPGRMASVDEDKLGLRPFSNPFVYKSIAKRKSAAEY